mgnify:CR=1 FL=1
MGRRGGDGMSGHRRYGARPSRRGLRTCGTAQAARLIRWRNQYSRPIVEKLILSLEPVLLIVGR